MSFLTSAVESESKTESAGVGVDTPQRRTAKVWLFGYLFYSRRNLLKNQFNSVQKVK